jgi:hypothetical protein
MQHSLKFTFCPETFVFTVKGKDLETMSQIFSEIGFQDLRRQGRTCNPYLKPLLLQSPDAMKTSKDLSGVGTLTVKCTDLMAYGDILVAVCKAFYATCDPRQMYSGTIGVIRGIDPLASERVLDDEWPISDGSPARTVSTESIEFSALGI